MVPVANASVARMLEMGLLDLEREMTIGETGMLLKEAAGG